MAVAKLELLDTGTGESLPIKGETLLLLVNIGRQIICIALREGRNGEAKHVECHRDAERFANHT